METVAKLVYASTYDRAKLLQVMSYLAELRCKKQYGDLWIWYYWTGFANFFSVEESCTLITNHSCDSGGQCTLAVAVL